jgi:DNA-binding transcriptional LysR family regulator
MIVAIPAGHQLERLDVVPLAALADETFVVPSVPDVSGIDDTVAIACAKAGFVPRRIHQGSQVPTLIHLVAAGFGISLVPSCDRRVAADGVVFRDIAPPVPKYTFSVIRHEWRSSPVARTFSEFLAAEH